MPVTVVWDNPDRTVLRYDFEGTWTTGEYLAVEERARSLLATVDHRVDALVDLRQSAAMPPGILPAVRTLLLTPHAKFRMTIIVVDDSMFRRVVKAAVKYLPITGIIFVESVEAAYNHITGVSDGE